MDSAPTAPPRPKVAAIQALRALAALGVAVVHLTYAFARHIDARLAFLPPGDQLAQSGVALFFVISGGVMVLSSRGLFGRPRGSAVFWRRRAVRVLPPYWIATALLATVLLALGLPFAWSDVARSLVFAIGPAGSGAPAPFALFLWPGWTLFYELLFYALFGACVAFGRSKAVALCSAALVVLIAIGTVAGSASLFAVAATRPVMLLFIAGMAIGLALETGQGIPAWARWACLAAAVAVFAFVPGPAQPLGFGYLAWAGLPAVLLCVAALGGPLRLPFGRWIELLGDASYAIYLLHVPFAHAWMRLFNGE